MRVRCKSGIEGWQGRLRDGYAGFEEFKAYARLYGLHTRLGYKTPETAWRCNPMVQGSIIPGDFRKVKDVGNAGQITRRRNA